MKYEPLSQDRIDAAVRSGLVPPRHRPGEMFLKGPIPLKWIHSAAVLPGKTFTVAIAVWFRAGITKDRCVKVTRALLEPFGVGRKAGYAGLRSLEAAGLVSVARRTGRAPIVTILSVDNGHGGGMVSGDDTSTCDVTPTPAADLERSTRGNPE